MGVSHGENSQMTLIQLLLCVGALGALLLYLLRFRSVLLDRAIACGLFALALLSILNPDLTTRIAHLVGVGRGADLVFYISVVATVFALLLLYTKQARLAENQTKLVRAMAIERATWCGGGERLAHYPLKRSHPASN